MALTKINSSVIANNTIAVGNIADNSVDATKIASNSILTRHIDDFATIDTNTALDDIATGDAESTLATSTGSIILDSPSAIKLDADGGEVQFKDGGTEIGSISMGSQNMNIESKVADKDIVFKGIDGSSDVTAMTIDMSEAGNVGIGTTTATNAKLEVVATSGEVFRADANGGAYRIVANQTGVNMNGNVGIGDSNPQHPFKVHLTDGEIAMFGSNGMNSPGNYAGIGLGQVLANNTTYQKVSLVTEGRNSGSYVQDFHILVDTVADANSAVLSDAKLTIDGGTGAVTMPSQPCFSVALPAVTAAGNVIVWGGEHLDVGNNYNTSNGRFTAPIAGNYFFAHWLLFDPSGSNHYSRTTYRKNGTASTQWGDNLENASREATGDYHSVGLAAIIPLAANDYVDVYNGGQSPTYGTDYGNFSGFLVS
jgi:hypothetical protein